MARPIPLVPPVTMAVFPAKVMMTSILREEGIFRFSGIGTHNACAGIGKAECFVPVYQPTSF
jgi:hypothetical protein